MDKVATSSSDFRRELFQETSDRMGISTRLVEKDFWVCWALHRLFSTLSDFPAAMLFKGGTSLSKAYGVIERFSEDIDLSLSREDLGFLEEKDPYNAQSKKQASRLLDELTETCEKEIRERLFPELEKNFTQVLGVHGSTWSLKIDKQDAQTILFAYPCNEERSAGDSLPVYIQPVVRLEIGARSDHWPAKKEMIEPYAATHFPNLFLTTQASVQTLAPERTFWEKITLLHAEHHRPGDKVIGDRLSRHYYDVSCLYKTPIAKRALENKDLLTAVVRHKSLFFRSAWANYETAVQGNLRLIPSQERISELKKDYADMSQMIFNEVPSFDEILSDIEKLEQEINAA